MWAGSADVPRETFECAPCQVGALAPWLRCAEEEAARVPAPRWNRPISECFLGKRVRSERSERSCAIGTHHV